MKFNKLEIIELSKIGASLNVPMSLKIDSDNSIDYDFSNDKSIQSILKKNDNGYQFYGINSNGIDFSHNSDKFEQIKYHIRNFVKAIKRDNPYELERKKNIEKLSENFYSIFQEATIIDELGFTESSGMIFRKSLENVVKDFLKIQLPESYSTLIEEKTIGGIIFNFYQKENGELIIRKSEKFNEIRTYLEKIRPLTKIISITFDIGNDFSHYERRLTEFTSKDMKINILKIIEFIDNSLEEQILKENQDKLSKEFDSNKLINKKY